MSVPGPITDMSRWTPRQSAFGTVESIAEPGAICVSSAAYEHVRGKVGLEFAFRRVK